MIDYKMQRFTFNNVFVFNFIPRNGVNNLITIYFNLCKCVLLNIPLNTKYYLRELN